jgi:hypothetical protein
MKTHLAHLRPQLIFSGCRIADRSAWSCLGIAGVGTLYTRFRRCLVMTSVDRRKKVSSCDRPEGYFFFESEIIVRRDGGKGRIK